MEVGEKKPKRKTLQDRYMEEGPDFSWDHRDEIDVKKPEWKYDPIPEIMDGKNIADFIDPDILEVRLSL